MRKRKKAGNPQPTVFNPFRLMWVVVMFDLPVKTRANRKSYTKFRKRLESRGFCRLQYSIYARSCPTDEKAVVQEQRVVRDLPPEGAVRIARITDMQFGRMRSYIGKKAVNPEEPPDQLQLF